MVQERFHEGQIALLFSFSFHIGDHFLLFHRPDLNDTRLSQPTPKPYRNIILPRENDMSGLVCQYEMTAWEQDDAPLYAL